MPEEEGIVASTAGQLSWQAPQGLPARAAAAHESPTPPHQPRRPSVPDSNIRGCSPLWPPPGTAAPPGASQSWAGPATPRRGAAAGTWRGWRGGWVVGQAVSGAHCVRKRRRRRCATRVPAWGPARSPRAIPPGPRGSAGAQRPGWGPGRCAQGAACRERQRASIRPAAPAKGCVQLQPRLSSFKCWTSPTRSRTAGLGASWAHNIHVRGRPAGNQASPQPTLRPHCSCKQRDDFFTSLHGRRDRLSHSWDVRRQVPLHRCLCVLPRARAPYFTR